MTTRKLAKAKGRVGVETPLSVRYAEIVRLRQAIDKTTQSGNPTSAPPPKADSSGHCAINKKHGAIS